MVKACIVVRVDHTAPLRRWWRGPQSVQLVGIAVAAVGHVGHSRAPLAGSEIGGDECGSRAPPSLSRMTTRAPSATEISSRWVRCARDAVWCGAAAPARHISRAAFHSIATPSGPLRIYGEVERARQAVGRRAEPDALHRAPNRDPPPERRRRRRFPLLPGCCHALPGVDEEVTAGFIIGEDPNSVKQQPGTCAQSTRGPNRASAWRETLPSCPCRRIPGTRARVLELGKRIPLIMDGAIASRFACEGRERYDRCGEALMIL